VTVDTLSGGLMAILRILKTNTKELCLMLIYLFSGMLKDLGKKTAISGADKSYKSNVSVRVE